MSLIGSRHPNYSSIDIGASEATIISSDLKYENRRLHGAKETTEETLKSIAKFTLDNYGRFLIENETQMLERFLVKDLSYRRVGNGIDFILSKPYILIASDNNFHRTPINTIVVTRDIDISQINELNLSARDIQVQRLSLANANITVISLQAWNYINEYHKSLSICNRVSNSIRNCMGFMGCEDCEDCRDCIAKIFKCCCCSGIITFVGWFSYFTYNYYKD